jgi:hypothetical protein
MIPEAGKLGWKFINHLEIRCMRASSMLAARGCTRSECEMNLRISFALAMRDL